jgi:hypothetical protein
LIISIPYSLYRCDRRSESPTKMKKMVFNCWKLLKRECQEISDIFAPWTDLHQHLASYWPPSRGSCMQRSKAALIQPVRWQEKQRDRRYFHPSVLLFVPKRVRFSLMKASHQPYWTDGSIIPKRSSCRADSVGWP